MSQLNASKAGLETLASSETRVPESILVVGTGSAGSRHMENARLLGVGSISVLSTGLGVRTKEIPSQVRVFTDFEAALSVGIKAAILANPTSLHVPCALAAAKAGCHLLIEKPLSCSLASVDDLVAEVAARKLVAMVGYQFRFHPTLLRIRHWLKDEAIGEVVSARASWGEYLPAWQPWRDYRTSYAARKSLGGGVVLTLSHPIDYLRWLLGEIESVSATMRCHGGLELDVEDTALLQLEFVNSVVASVQLDFVQRPPEHHLTIVGRKGVIRWNNADGVAILDTHHERFIATPPESFERNDMFVSEMSHFFREIRGVSEPFCSLADGERVLRICLAAKESAIEGRRVDV